jgi:F0F1-type ATP synthase membrane subunit c/vacuolar-type H+-ATPase subunit K
MPQAIETPNGIQITLGGILSAAARSKNDSRSVEAMARQPSN